MTDVTLLDGLLGGLLATIVMTVFMMTLGDDSPPPTALFYAEYVGDGSPDEYMMQGMVLHFIYGISAGGALALLLILAGIDPIDSVEALLAGLSYGVGLFVGAAVFWMKIVLDMDPEPRDVGLFALFHIVYGLVLGAVIAVGVIGIDLV